MEADIPYTKKNGETIYVSPEQFSHISSLEYLLNSLKRTFSEIKNHINEMIYTKFDENKFKDLLNKYNTEVKEYNQFVVKIKKFSKSSGKKYNIKITEMNIDYVKNLFIKTLKTQLDDVNKNILDIQTIKEDEETEIAENIEIAELKDIRDILKTNYSKYSKYKNDGKSKNRKSRRKSKKYRKSHRKSRK